MEGTLFKNDNFKYLDYKFLTFSLALLACERILSLSFLNLRAMYFAFVTVDGNLVRFKSRR